MRVQSSNFVQLASRVYQQLPILHPAPTATAPAIPQRPAACLAHLRSLARDERVLGIGAIIASSETPLLVRLLGGLVDLRKGIALRAPLEGLVITPWGLETLVDGRPQGLAPIPLFDTCEDLVAFRHALDRQLTCLYEDCCKLQTRYFAPKNALAVLLICTPDEM